MMVPLFSGGAVSRCGEGSRRHQASRVVRNGEPAVGAETFGVAIGQVAIDDGEQVGDLVF